MVPLWRGSSHRVVAQHQGLLHIAGRMDGRAWALVAAIGLHLPGQRLVVQVGQQAFVDDALAQRGVFDRPGHFNVRSMLRFIQSALDKYRCSVPAMSK